MASDAEIEATATEMNLPIDAVAAIYASDETSGNEATADGSEASSPQATESQTPPSESPSGDADSGISEKLANRAQHYGLDPKAFRDADSLQAQIDAYDQRIMASQGQQQQAPQQQPSQQQARQQLYDQNRAAQAAEQQAGQQQLDPFKFDLGDEYDQDEVDKFNAGLQKVAERYDPVVAHVQQLTQLVQQQQEYIQQVQQQEYQTQVEQSNKAFDEAVDAIGADIFGKGRYETLDQGSQAQRMKLMESAHTLATGYTERGIPIPEMPDLVEQAFRLTFAEEAKKTNQAELRERVVSRSNRRLGTGKTSKSSHLKANGEVKPYRGKDPEKDEVLLGAYNQLIAEQDFS